MKELSKFNIKGVIVHNFWLKFISLVIAILIWVYISGMITGGGPTT